MLAHPRLARRIKIHQPILPRNGKGIVTGAGSQTIGRENAERAEEPRRVPAPEANTVTKKDRTSPSVLMVQAKRGECSDIGERSKRRGLVLIVCMYTTDASSGGWFLDSGATAHICMSRSKFRTYRKADPDQTVILGNGTQLTVKGSGEVLLTTSNGNSLELHEVLHVPAISKNLVSVTQLVREGNLQVIFSRDTKDGANTIVVGRLEDDLYQLAVKKCI